MTDFYKCYFMQKERDKSALEFSLKELKTEITQQKVITKYIIDDLEIKEDYALEIARSLPLKIRNAVYNQIILKSEDKT